MYFAVLGKNPEISLAELELVQIKEISYPKKGIIIFDTKYSELLPQLWWCIKIGTVVKEKDLQELLADVKIIWIQNEANGKHLKRTVWIRRYKLVDVFHTDREIKTKGKEIINLENGLYGVVEWYQNIELYEAVDFGKPGRSMKMGMMPAKLAHIMMNIWLKNIIEYWKSEIENCVIYDPFVGSWTTGMLANHFGYDFIGSDIKTDFAEQNATRRKTTKFYTPDKQFGIFTHDIKEKIWQIRKKSDKSEKNLTTDNETIKKILKIVTEIHIKYGNTLTEKQYGKLIEAKIKKEWIAVGREKSIIIEDDGIMVWTKYMDLIVDNQIVIELKNTPYIHKQDLKQTRAYLDLWNYQTWLLINFGESKIHIARLEKDYQKPEKTLTPFSENFSDLSEYLSDLSDILIITEWRLWPIVTKTTSSQDVQKFQEQVLHLYKSFLDRIHEIWAIAVFTIPYYAGQDNSLQKNISDYADKIWLHIDEIPEIYGRERQQVGRKILIISPK